MFGLECLGFPGVWGRGGAWAGGFYSRSRSAIPSHRLGSPALACLARSPRIRSPSRGRGASLILLPSPGAWLGASPGVTNKPGGTGRRGGLPLSLFFLLIIKTLPHLVRNSFSHLKTIPKNSGLFFTIYNTQQPVL